ncbi:MULTISPECIES: 5-oxoprolinase/urea amidolyase family protein [Nitrosomonas]|nr:5-oxoprolinase/urea amidolyase family protein [Nitrosomonas europaea]SDW68050.1 urea carboxylase [Nitrosomonas europaea]SET25903.1 urea carboxylase [Nitrosomonas europaea]SJZ80181.1 urea carboxylase [Nitrosomonas europaea]HBF23925.1 urea amidolyase [Nitrosomonas sp.]
MSEKTLDTNKIAAPTIDVLVPGIQTTIQDYPGRRGYWNIGVPPSGPMDNLAFRLANRLAGNEEGQAAIEITFAGPTLRINCDTVIAVTGAPIEVNLNGKPLAQWKSHEVAAGALLAFGDVLGQGSRVYLAIQGGIQVPDYLGSKATFMLGQFGGHEGRILQAGDVLNVVAGKHDGYTPRELPQVSIPHYTHHWEIAVLYGPHGAPDFFTEEGVANFFAADWTVHHNSDRTGVRLIGPKPKWARTDGGEAGLHPSNVHDVAYSIGAVDFTGDLPVILGPDGPSLGGFVCLVTLVHAELWKMGQLRPGDRITFRRISAGEAATLEAVQDALISDLRLPEAASVSTSAKVAATTESPILHTIPESSGQVQVVYRQGGDRNLLVEYGPMMLDFNLRFRVHVLMEWLQQAVESGDLPGIIDLTPGIRSLHIRFDAKLLPRKRLLDTLITAEKQLPAIENVEVPTRIVHLPLSWNDSSVQLAMKKYMQSVRKDAPWNPDNIEFIRRINGLDSIDEVRRIVFDASYMVMGLGDVYLGAPLGTPVDPRHRLVTTKYNPARTWTPENAVGIGGAYMCVYGMESPGGYQLVGRTVQMWNTHVQTKDFREGKPWLLRFFDQVRFYPVTEAELAEMRKDFPSGKFTLRIEEDRFSLKQYNDFLKENAASIDTFRTKQKAAYIAERERWKAEGQENYTTSEILEDGSAPADITISAGAHAIHTHVTGIVWKLLVSEGQRVNAGDDLAVLESMKMEFTVNAPISGVIQRVLSKAGSKVTARQVLFVIEGG